MLKADSCAVQAKWLQQQLAAAPADDWLVAMGHNPAYQIDVEDLTSQLLQKPVHLYLNGHIHYLSQYQYKGHAADFITTGAGCMVDTQDQKADPPFTEADHSFLYNEKVSGFSLHTFSDDFSTLTTEFIGTDGKTLHTFVTSKDGKSPPSPPPAPPAPGGTCKELGCDYNPAHTCQCNYQCVAHDDCCADYQKVCDEGHHRRRRYDAEAAPFTANYV